MAWTKEDQDKYNREYYQQNKEAIKTQTAAYRESQTKEVRRVYSKRWRARNLEQKLVTAARARAKKKGVAFNLTKEDIDIPEICPVLKVPLVFSDGGPRCDGTPSLDRIIPSLGYVKNNVRVISWRANMLKSDATVEELQLILKDMETENALVR